MGMSHRTKAVSFSESELSLLIQILRGEHAHNSESFRIQKRLARIQKQKPKKNFFRWVVQLDVHKTWVEDGFDLTDERAHDMLGNDLTFAVGFELGAKVLSSPQPDQIKKVQGGDSQ